MSALAAACLAASEGVEPILYMTTRDRNRIALLSDRLGAQALGIRNILCTTGTFANLGPLNAAKKVFDLDSIQLVDAFARSATDCASGSGPIFLGAAATPDADPMELQVVRLAKKIDVGAAFLITAPVFDLERFRTWWAHVVGRGLHEKTAVLAGIRPLTGAEEALDFARKRPAPRGLDAVVERIVSKTGEMGQRTAGIDTAVESIERLSDLEGLRGFAIREGRDPEAVCEIMARCGLGV